MNSEYAIRVEDVSKLYKLYDKPSDRFKEALGLTRKKKYHEHYALHHLSFDVKKGETVGIIGTNGAGKSTILKIITGVLSATEGNVEINGRISALLELGAGFNMEYTGIENIYLNGTMIGFSREEIEEKMEDILSFADIGDFVYQPVKTYSSGMFVRLAFAVAINIDPEILIVDEALSVGDAFFQAKCYKKFDDFKEAGKTVIFVSHDLSSISRYCDRVVLMNKGRKLSEGSPKDMINLYKKVMVGALQEKEEKTEETSFAFEQKENLADPEGALGENTHTGKEKSFSEKKNEKKKLWKSHFQLNPNVDEYGDGRAEIIDFALVDENGMLSSSIMKGGRFTIKSKVAFHSRISNPIFTYTIKNLQGLAITGTNTMYEKESIGWAEEGDIYLASFEQEMNLQGGEYLLSISCTGYENGDFCVYHRLYDVLNITVISQKDTVGFYDMNSLTKLVKVEE
jgi:teichoic acid transport system ATP-binding protein